MNREGKIRFTLILTVVGLLIAVTYLATDRVAKSDNINESIAALTQEVRELKKMPSPKDGYSPIKGIDYDDGRDGSNGRSGKNGVDGTNGVNALSTHTENTVIKEVPIEGKAGEDGKDAPILQIRLNPYTSDLETKLSDNTFWETLIPCGKLLVGCSTSGL